MVNSYPETIDRSDESVALEVNKSQNITMINTERENRLSRIISLYSKGLTQSVYHEISNSTIRSFRVVIRALSSLLSLQYLFSS